MSNTLYDTDFVRWLSKQAHPCLDLPAALGRGYPRAKRKAVNETRFDDHNFPAECPFSPEQALDQDFLPE